jgi:chromosome segregation ATPase
MSDDATRNLLSDRFDQLTTLVKSVIANQSKTDARVERLERVLEERLYDTRPIWEALRAQVQELEGRVGAIESEITEMRAEMTGMRAEMTGMRAEMTGMRAEMTAMRAQLTEMLTQMIEMLRHITEMRVETGNGFRAVDRKIGVLGKTLIDMTADIRELQDKVEKIESQPT